MDEKYMRRAIELAEKGRGRVSPNPLVGAVVVKDDAIVGEGYHARAGSNHAEVVALKDAGKESEGATLYTTLEPCSIYGFTPPCTKTIIEAGIAKVVVGLVDPNPKVCGGGIEELKKAGIKVDVGVLTGEGERQNEIYIKYITTGEPFVLMKVAASLDGKISIHNGERSKITGEASIVKVHELRDSFDAIMVGVGTVLADNPKLATRLKGRDGKNPLRVIVDSEARTPLNTEVVATAKEIPTIIVTTEKASERNINQLQEKGVEILTLSDVRGKVDLKSLLKELGERKITSVLLEGGATLNAAVVRDGFVDKFLFFLAPKIFGGLDSLNMIDGEIGDLAKLKIVSSREVGEDLLIEAYPK